MTNPAKPEPKTIVNFEDLDGPGLLDFLRIFLYQNERDPLKILTNLKRDYGSTVRVHFPDFGGEVLLLSDPDTMREVLLERQKEFKKPDTPVSDDVEEIMGNGLLTTDGEDWRRQHRILMPHFQDDAVESMVPIVDAETDRLLKRWQSPSFSQPFNLFREMKRVGLRFICRALFSYNMDRSEVHEIRECIDTLRAAYRKRRTSLVTFPLWLPTPNTVRARRCRRILHEFANKLIANRRSSDSSRGDLLETMVESAYGADKAGLSMDEVRAEIVTFIIAGYTTTAAAMGWTIYELLNHPSDYEKVRDEAQQAWRENEPGTVLDSIPYTTAAFDETLRLYPTAPWIARSTRSEITVNGLRLPAETPIVMTPYLLHHTPELFDQPQAFRPDRFLDDKRPEPMAYLPFSVGAHQCIGREIALMEGPFILSKIFARGRIQRTPSTPDTVDIHTAVNIEPDRPIPVGYTSEA